MSYLLGTFTLIATTLLYVLLWFISAPFWAWAVVSALLGLGFTFFSGATEAWLVDALNFTKFEGKIDNVFAKGQMMSGVAMLAGSVGGGVLAQFTNVSVPYILRATILGLTFILAFLLMHDLGFSPQRSANLWRDVKQTFSKSFSLSFRNPAIRYLMLASMFTAGVGFYTFYALQPFLLELYGDNTAYTVAGLVAALVAGAQIAGGFTVSHIQKRIPNRLSLMLLSTFVTGILLILTALSQNFYLALVLIFIWGLLSAVLMPTRQAYLNSLIASENRATVLSFDNLVGSSGGIFIQPVLGRAADLWSYATSFIIAAIIHLCSLPFLLAAKKSK